MKQAQSTTVQNRFLTFKLLGEKYGIDILSIKEIIGYQKTIPVHKTPEYVKGVINLRGQIIPVIDLTLRFGLPEQDHTMYTAIIIATIHGISIGLIVDEVNEVANVPDDALSNPPEFGSSISVSYLSKMAQIDQNVIMILDLDNIMDSQDVRDIHQSSKQNGNQPTQGNNE